MLDHFAAHLGRVGQIKPGFIPLPTDYTACEFEHTTRLPNSQAR